MYQLTDIAKTTTTLTLTQNYKLNKKKPKNLTVSSWFIAIHNGFHIRMLADTLRKHFTQQLLIKYSTRRLA